MRWLHPARSRWGREGGKAGGGGSGGGGLRLGTTPRACGIPRGYGSHGDPAVSPQVTLSPQGGCGSCKRATICSSWCAAMSWA